VACHVAVELTRQTNGTALLADLDFQTGWSAFLAKPSRLIRFPMP